MRFLLLDVLTDTPLTGNQLAVFPDGGSVPEGVPDAVASVAVGGSAVLVGEGRFSL
jgi:predicted PhzF superfamily epimerase YddE/YHI9